MDPRRFSPCRLLLCCLAPGLLIAAAGAQPVLQHLGTVSTPAPVARGNWGDEAVAVTALDARLVTWTNAELSRSRVLFELPAAPTLVDAWEDSVLIQVPGEGGRLLVRGVTGPGEWIEEPANWRLPNTRIDGESYRVLVDPYSFLLVYSAPGPGGILGLLDFPSTIGQAEVWAWDGAQVLLGNADAVYAVSLANPRVPVFTGTIEPPDEGAAPTAVAVRGEVGFVHWGDRIASYSIGSASAPPQLDEISDGHRFLAVNERWLVSWGDGAAPRSLIVYDAGDPAALTPRAALTAAVDLGEARISVVGDRIEIGQAGGLQYFDIPAGTAPPVDRGFAWPVLEGWPLATAGNTAWLQGDGRRYVVDLVGREVARVQDRDAGTETASLLVRDELLLDNRGGGLGVSIESLADPREPQVLSVLDPEPGLAGIDVAGDLLAAADGSGLVLYDLTDPAAPERRGELPLAGAAERVLVAGTVAVVTAVRDVDPDLAHVVDLADPDAPQLVTSFALENPGWPAVHLHAFQLVRRADNVHILMAGTDGGLEAASATATLDLGDPSSPQLGFEAGGDFWCFEDDPDSGGLAATLDLPVSVGDLHVSFRADTVAVHAYAGGADLLVRQAAWVAPGPIQTLAAAGNMLLVQTEHRLDLLTLSDPDPVAAPGVAVRGVVKAVPNPFNPRTALRIEMPRAGEAEVEIFDLRGRRVRRLAARLPAGAGQVIWDGEDGAGGAVPSGTYLVRVRLPGGALAGGRCQLVR